MTIILVWFPWPWQKNALGDAFQGWGASGRAQVAVPLPGMQQSPSLQPPARWHVASPGVGNAEWDP